MSQLDRTAASGLVLALVLSGPAALAEEEGRQAQQSGNARGNTMSLEAEEIDDAEVVDSNGNRIGELDELVRGEDGKTYAVISIGGFLDVGEKEIAMPLDRLSMHGERLVLPKEISSVAHLDDHDEFNQASYTELEDEDQIQVKRSALAARKKGSGSTITVEAEEIDGAEVVDRNGNEVGEVDEIVRGEDGKTYAVISVGGFLDIGDKEIAMPLDQLATWGEKVLLPADIDSVDQLKEREEYNEDLHTELEDEDKVQVERAEFAAMETDADIGRGSGREQATVGQEGTRN